MKIPRVYTYHAVDAPETHEHMVIVGIPTGNNWAWVNCFGSTEVEAMDKARVIIDEWVEKRSAYEARTQKAVAAKARASVAGA